MLDWISNILESLGLIGVAVLMFIENVFPPIPSEVVMPLAGFNAARGTQTLLGVTLAGIIGSLAGAAFWYWVGRRIGARRIRNFACRHGRWLTLQPDDIDAAQDWFRRHGRLAVFFGRLVPTVRTFVSVPAGVARMPFALFMFYTSLGTAVWTTLLAVAGYWLEGQYEKVSHWLDPLSTGLLILFALWYAWRVWTYQPQPVDETEDRAVADTA